MKRVIKSTEISEGNVFLILFRNTVNIIAGLIESFLLIRILLRLFGANAQNGFVDFIYKVSSFFARPFSNIFKDFEIQDGMIFEINTLLAVVVYALLAWIIVSVFVNLTYKKVQEEFTDVE